MRILLTGATGFIGNAFYQTLKDEHDVFLVIRKEQKNTFNGNLIIWDFSNPFPYDQLPKKIDVIIHVAQSKRYREFPQGSLDMFNVNLMSTAFLLDYASSVGVNQFILISSGTVYEPFQQNIMEDIPLFPSSYYASTKYASEILAKCYEKLFGVCILRLFFPYGPGQQDRLIPNLIERIQNELPVTLAGKDGMTIVPTFVEDIVGFLKTAIDSSAEGIFNIAAPNESISLRSLSQLIGSQLNKIVKFEIKEPEYVENEGKQKLGLSIVPNLDRMKSIYAHPFVGINEGIRRVLGK